MCRLSAQGGRLPIWGANRRPRRSGGHSNKLRVKKRELAERETTYLEHTHHDSLQGKNRRKFVFLLVRNYDYFCPRRKLLVRNPKFHTYTYYYIVHLSINP